MHLTLHTQQIDNYGVSVTYGQMLKMVQTCNDTYTALNGYYSFDNGLNISAGYEIGDLDGEAATADETESFFVGINGMKLVQDLLGVAIGTYGTMD